MASPSKQPNIIQPRVQCGDSTPLHGGQLNVEGPVRVMTRRIKVRSLELHPLQHALRARFSFGRTVLEKQVAPQTQQTAEEHWQARVICINSANSTSATAGSSRGSDRPIVNNGTRHSTTQFHTTLHRQTPALPKPTHTNTNTPTHSPGDMCTSTCTHPHKQALVAPQPLLTARLPGAAAPTPQALPAHSSTAADPSSCRPLEPKPSSGHIWAVLAVPWRNEAPQAMQPEPTPRPGHISLGLKPQHDGTGHKEMAPGGLGSRGAVRHLGHMACQRQDIRVAGRAVQTMIA